MTIIKKILIEKKTGKKFIVKETQTDFITPFGMISCKDLQSKKDFLISNKGSEFLVVEPSFTDLAEFFQRGPQVMLAKDVGLIITKTGINQQSLAVDAGGGSGFLSLALANVCKHVTIYETSNENVQIIKKNSELSEIKNITIKKQNIYDGISEKDLDVVTLDLPEPWQVLPHLEASLKRGGFLVVYLPNLTQVHEFYRKAKGSCIHITETIELLERKWKIEEKIMRPEFEMLGHTGFLTFGRKI